MKNIKIRVFFNSILSFLIIFNYPIFIYSSDDYINTENSEVSIHSIRNHPKAVVRNAGKLGFGIGSIIGVPISIVALPVTGIIYIIERQPRKQLPEQGEGIVFIMPMAITGEVFRNVFGGISWVFFGWWGKEVKKLKNQPTTYRGG